MLGKSYKNLDFITNNLTILLCAYNSLGVLSAGTDCSTQGSGLGGVCHGHLVNMGKRGQKKYLDNPQSV